MRFVWMLLVLASCPRGVSGPSTLASTSLSGRVIDELGKPVVGVTVVVNRCVAERKVRPQCDEKYRDAVTTSGGEFQFQVAPGRYQITIYYLELTIEREIEVRGPTVMNQSIHPLMGGGETQRCTGDTLASCGWTAARIEEAERKSAEKNAEEKRVRDAADRASEAKALAKKEAAAQALAAKEKAALDAENKKKATSRRKQGQAFLSESVFDKALEEFRAAYELSPTPELHYDFGLAFEGLKDRSSALDSYRRYLDSQPDGPLADQARKRIAVLTRELRKK